MNILDDIKIKVLYKENYKETLELCNEAIKMYVNNETLYFYRGLVYFNLQQYKKAIEDFDKIENLDNETADVYYYKASSYFNLRKYEEAIEYFTKAIEIYNIYPVYYNSAYYNRGRAYLNLDRYEEAMQDFDVSLMLFKKYEEAMQDFDASLMLFKKYKITAFNNINISEELCEKILGLFCNIGLIYFRLGKYIESIKSYDEALNYCSYYEDILYVFRKKVENFIKLGNKNEILDIYSNIYKVNSNIFEGKVYNTYYIFDNLSSLTSNAISMIDKNECYICNNQSLLTRESIIDEYKYIIEKILDNDFDKTDCPKIKNNSLYNFTKINTYTLRSILNGKLWLSNTKEFNDPVDPCIKRNSMDNIYQYILCKIKVACLTTYNDNTLMWSHYADKHRGICIEYDISKLLKPVNNIIIKKVYYGKKMLANDRFTDIIGGINIDNRYINSIIELFSTKSKEWKYEDEYRILFYDKEKKYEDKNGILISLPIKSICFGVETTMEDKEIVSSIIKHVNEINKKRKKKRIKLYQAELGDNELFKINIKPYKNKSNN